jgi:hypothetical protein
MRNKIISIILLSAMWISPVFCKWVFAANINFTDFSNTSILSLNGDTAVVTTNDGKVLRLAPAASWKSGTAFSIQTLSALQFSTFFKFRITESGGDVFDCNTEPGADGIVFVVQSVSSSIGGSGEGIGYSGIDTSVGVEFDTWCNESNNDPNSNHIGIDLNGVVEHQTESSYTVNISPNFDNGALWYVWVDYNGTTLEVRINQTSERPATPNISRQINISEILGQGTAYIGFSSGTGLAWSNHDIISWEYRDYYDPIVIDCDCKKWDYNCNDKVDLTDIIYGLQIISGEKNGN